jgi:hypothetical protein
MQSGCQAQPLRDSLQGAPDNSRLLGKLSLSPLKKVGLASGA